LTPFRWNISFFLICICTCWFSQTYAADSTSFKPSQIPDQSNQVTPPIKSLLGEEDELIIDEGEEDIFSSQAKKKKLQATQPAKQSSTNTAAENQPTQDTDVQPESQPSPEDEQRYNDEDYYQSGEKNYLNRAAEMGRPPTDEKPVEDTTTEVIGPAIIEKASSINFARNLKEYRSPRTALFLSLLLPGAGQAYAKRYVKTAIFGAIEIAAIASAVGYSRKGRTARTSAWKFADSHYSSQKMMHYYETLEYFLKNNTSLDSTRYTDVLRSVIYDTAAFTQSAAESGNDYYQGLKDLTYVQGWDDCEPRMDSTGYIVSSPDYRSSYAVANEDQGDTTYMVYRLDVNGDTLNGPDHLPALGFSENVNTYSKMVSKADNYYRISNYFIYGLVVNHIVSAIDALITAKAYNDKLLEKQSMWQRLNLDHQLAWTNAGVSSCITVSYRF
jgi:hypothetical protein